MSDQKNNKAINIALWIAQVLLGLMFIMAGSMKVFQPVEVLVESLPWATSVPLLLVKFSGVSELLGGLGLLLPSLLRIKPFLTTWAAIGLAAVMILAAIFHATRGEFSDIIINIILLSLALFIAWGRSKKAVILSKN